MKIMNEKTEKEIKDAKLFIEHGDIPSGIATLEDELRHLDKENEVLKNEFALRIKSMGIAIDQIGSLNRQLARAKALQMPKLVFSKEMPITVEGRNSVTFFMRDNVIDGYWGFRGKDEQKACEIQRLLAEQDGKEQDKEQFTIPKEAIQTSQRRLEEFMNNQTSSPTCIPNAVMPLTVRLDPAQLLTLCASIIESGLFDKKFSSAFEAASRSRITIRIAKSI